MLKTIFIIISILFGLLSLVMLRGAVSLHGSTYIGQVIVAVAVGEVIIWFDYYILRTTWQSPRSLRFTWILTILLATAIGYLAMFWVVAGLRSQVWLFVFIVFAFLLAVIWAPYILYKVRLKNIDDRNQDP